MKKSTFLKLALMFIAMLMFTGTYAQDDQATKGDVHDVNLVTGTPLNRDTVTVGFQTKYVALPDPFYHASYVTPAWTLTAGFTWAWTFFAADGTTPLTVTTDYTTAAGAKANETLVTWVTTGNRVLKVAETSPAGFGGCADASPSTQNVAVVPEPIRVSFPYFNTTLGLASTQTYAFCGDQLGLNMTVNLTGYPHFEMEWTLTRQEIDFSGVGVGGVTTVVNNTGASAQVLGTNNFTTVSTAATFTFDALRDLTLQAGKRTKYIYTMKGVNDLYSRKSDYVAGTTSWFPLTPADQIFNIIINPAPATGPIYHVPNNWGA